MAWREHPRALPWFGLCFGATYLCRGDSQALVVGLVVTLAFESYRRRRARREDPGIPTGLLPWRALIVRSQQDPSAEAVAKLPPSEEVAPLGKMLSAGEHWYMVRTKSGAVGWVRDAEVDEVHRAK